MSHVKRLNFNLIVSWKSHVKNPKKRNLGIISPALVAGGAKIQVYPGAPHGLTATHQDQVNADLLAFVREPARLASAAKVAQAVRTGK